MILQRSCRTSGGSAIICLCDVCTGWLANVFMYHPWNVMRRPVKVEILCCGTLLQLQLPSCAIAMSWNGIVPGHHVHARL